MVVFTLETDNASETDFDHSSKTGKASFSLYENVEGYFLILSLHMYLSIFKTS